MKFGVVDLSRQRPHHSVPKVSAASSGGAEGCGDVCRFTPNLRKPVWCPRQWLFFPVFNACYASMGLASYMVYVQQGYQGSSRFALQLYGTQLTLAWFWVPLLFGRRMLGLALVDSVLLAGVSGATLWCFAPISAGAAAIFAPTFLWSVYLALTSFFLWRRNSIVLKNG
ncbi:translocator protein-like [Dermacentor variabilis]|uniref:translocator protein-like n=1 Tax=Dermacentor variabilis TaxID=34621 RepID=UPI003F5B690C